MATGKIAGLTGLDGLAQADLVRRGEMSAAEALEAAEARAAAVNPRINAIVRPMPDEARASVAAGVPAGPFHGLPFLLKDLATHYKGVPTSGGSILARDAPVDHHTVLTERFLAAGCVVFGKTNTPEWGSLGTTEPLLWGPTRNPWDPEHSSGGSSGGSAAAVAARIVPVAHGNDGAGSIRIPASCCGLVGLKPTRGRISLGPDVGESLNGMTNEGVMSVTVRDTAAMLDATAGPTPGDPYRAPPPERPWSREVGAPVGRLRIAATRRSLVGSTLHPDCVAAVDDAMKLLADLGHEVVEDAPPLDAEIWRTYYMRFWPQGVGRTLHRYDRQNGWAPGTAASRSDPVNRLFYSLAMQVKAVDYTTDLAWFHGVARAFARWQHEGRYDVWLTPTLGTPPPRLGHWNPDGVTTEAFLDRFLEFLPFTPFANMNGTPAISLPLHWNAAGLPVGTMFGAAPGEEGLLIRLAAQLEEARPWRDRLPPIRAT